MSEAINRIEEFLARRDRLWAETPHFDTGEMGRKSPDLLVQSKADVVGDMFLSRNDLEEVLRLAKLGKGTEGKNMDRETATQKLQEAHACIEAVMGDYEGIPKGVLASLVAAQSELNEAIELNKPIS